MCFLHFSEPIELFRGVLDKQWETEDKFKCSFSLPVLVDSGVFHCVSDEPLALAGHPVVVPANNSEPGAFPYPLLMLGMSFGKQKTPHKFK